MRTRLLLAAVVFSLLGSAGARADHLKDPAEVLPAKTIVYGELRQPGQLVKEIGSLLEGSALENVPDSLTKLFGDRERPRHTEGLGAAGLLFSPEVIRELQRMHGAAVALTGMGKAGPEWVAVVLPGESNGPAFLMRTFLATGPVRPIGECEGVRLYQISMGGSRVGPRPGLRERPDIRPPRDPDREERKDRGEGERRDDRPARAVAEERMVHEPVLAITEEALLIGSVDAVKDVVRRVKGKAKGETLSDSRIFNSLRKEVGDRPGLFAYADPAGAMALLPKELPGVGRHELQMLRAFAELVNLKAFRGAGYGLSLEKGTLRYTKLVLLNPDEKSPVLDLFPTAEVSKDLLQFTPPDPVLVAALSNNNAKERWEKFSSALPAEALQGLAGMEKRLGIDFVKDLCGRINGVAFAMGNPINAPVKRTELKRDGRVIGGRVEVQFPVVFVVQATGEDAAKALVDEVLPKVIARTTEKDEVRPTTTEIEGQKIHRFDMGGHGEAALHYGRTGKMIVLGPYAQPVAQALGNGTKERGWLSDEKVAERLGKFDDTIAVAVARPFTLISAVLLASSGGSASYERRQPEGRSTPPERNSPPRREKDSVPPPREGDSPAEAKAVQPARPGAPAIADRGEEQVKKQLGEILKEEGLLIFRITRKPDRMMAEMTLTDLKPTVRRLVDFGLRTWMSEARPREGHPAPPRERIEPIRPKDSPPRDR